MKLKFNLKYFLLTLFIFLIEVLIATKLSGIFFVRAYLGDVIVVMLLYTLVKSFIKINDEKLILGILIFSCLVEFAQYFKIAEKLGFQPGSLMYIIIGNCFSWIDILCYAAGCLILYLFVKLKPGRNEDRRKKREAV
ncbi:MAG: DUF2809 domain-containing protein [Chryseobacterium sp.]|jgi:putative effector of murein hydrolase|uniref:ribosomal maturation YjgA family protein n=1 Tax=Chryseobacterium sp. TaxID=1871047 RepID=UPI002825B7E6|nr:DUF2809 domain-containing protein [Chryseobacterium sp.]MDR2234753.1 DUF2809 domain-containing protein [Chryseobacterium sp.]